MPVKVCTEVSVETMDGITEPDKGIATTPLAVVLAKTPAVLVEMVALIVV